MRSILNNEPIGLGKVIVNAGWMKFLELLVTNKIPAGLPGISLNFDRSNVISSLDGTIIFGNFSKHTALMSVILLNTS